MCISPISTLLKASWYRHLCTGKSSTLSMFSPGIRLETMSENGFEQAVNHILKKMVTALPIEEK